MKTLHVKLTADTFVLCVFLSLLWCVTESTTTTKPSMTSITRSPNTSPTTSVAKTVSVGVLKQVKTTVGLNIKTATSPGNSTVMETTTPTTTQSPTTNPIIPDVTKVKVEGQNESSVTLEWEKIGNFSTYRLHYTFNGTGKEEPITESEKDLIKYVVSPLSPGKKYEFTLFTVSGEYNSTGYKFEASTAPRETDSFIAATQNETSITLQWEKVDDILNYILEYNETNKAIIAEEGKETVTYNVLNLTSGVLYHFTLFTVFENIKSIGKNLSTATAPRKTDSFIATTQSETTITLQWQKVGDILNYILQYNETNTTIIIEEGEETVTRDVLNLTSGVLYHFTLFTVFENIKSIGKNLSTATAPRKTDSFIAATQNETSITLQWQKVDDILNYILQYNETNTTIIIEEGEETVTRDVLNLTSGVLYHFTLFTVFENIKSIGKNLPAATAPRKTDSFIAATQNETSITLQWQKVDDILNYILEYNETNKTISAEEVEETVTYNVQNLTSGVLYHFTLFTVFENIKSIGKKRSAATVPHDAQGFDVHNQTETSITLKWQKVGNILNYTIALDKMNISVDNATEENGTLMYTIPDLSSGVLYNFNLFTEFENLYSRGVKRDAATVPPTLASVDVTGRKLNSIDLKWENAREDWQYVLTINGADVIVNPTGSSNVVSYTVTLLEPGTKYPFTVTTVFRTLKSKAYESFTVTTIDCTSVDWHKTDSSIEGVVQGLVSNVTATNGSVTLISPGANNVSFTKLYPGATYNLSFVYENDSRTFPQCHHTLTIIPPSLSAVCKNWASGYSIYVEWNTPYGMWTGVEVNVAGKQQLVDQNGKHHAVISGFQPAKNYKVSIASVVGNPPIEKSEPFVFYCKTDDRGVIAGSIMGVLLFGVLICAIVFIMLKRPDIISKKTFIRGSKKPLKNKKSQPISVVNFPSHFHQLDADQNRGFSQEYENLGIVGTEQTQRVAVLPENKPKNRFTNILPYDWSRVKLNSSNPSGGDDYINANYMPGYNSNREYIATQGPLPSTVNDFWKMIWEQRVKGIVMVTNCTEGGRAKCEQYWPGDKKPVFHGKLMVTLSSEQQESNWTLREFRLQHTQTSEERTVQHFHFTAWPDHGVPQGTEVLVQFRRLVRHHIQTQAGKTPTVVHCSAGVGRTGTIIALDVLLQQLEKEKAVDINGFVYKMRLSRSHMVQTESQYIFLHQCIMDILQTNDLSNENIYENADMIYVNATALRELH